jgi:transcriptional regulator with XRE-family HTH domain
VNGLDLKVLRIRSGLRQYELAARLGMNPSRLSLVENGRLPLRAELARRAVTVLSGDSTYAVATGGEEGAKK